MYQVKAIIYAKDPEFPERKFERKYAGGLYIPKGKQAQKKKVSEDVAEYLNENLKLSHDNKHLEFDVVVTSVKRIKNDFILKEE